MTNPDRLRCPNCRTRRTDGRAMVLHLLKCKQHSCICGGYHFKHRYGSKLCVGNPYSELHLAVRRGEDADVLEDILIDIIFNNPGKPVAQSAACPF